MSLPVENRLRCMKAIARLFLTKGSRNELINSERIKSALEKIDKSYTVFFRYALRDSVEELKNTFGYIVNQGDAFGEDLGEPDKFYVSNSLKSNTLLNILSDQHDDAAYKGFCFVVFNIIWSLPGKIASGSEILVSLHRLDHRFPATYKEASSLGKRSTPAVPELGGHFSDLLSKMVNEGYLIRESEKESRNSTQDTSQYKYKLGVRFFNESDKLQLAYSYFSAIDQEPDMSVLNEVIQEAQRALSSND